MDPRPERLLVFGGVAGFPGFPGFPGEPGRRAGPSPGDGLPASFLLAVAPRGLAGLADCTTRGVRTTVKLHLFTA